ncbi:MAG TPA: alpha/beta hydrolase [Actinophytocola sp.]|uniref:alpha/beta fold hydrolase n=1 Tax=Actinophytocola sp. TaxID=1872138 RepID=UPI002DBBCFB3|nr:alpha/beta hydrolase [Actinophytocola sp.]HEU5475260.1 alpha/beta hydrolase [Actinophytocola sp.]
MTTPVVLLHALAADPGMWAAQHGELTAAGHPVVAPDLYRLAERSPGPPQLDALAAELVAALDRAGLDRVLLAGCSLGGYLAMAVLRKAPERVAGLALLGTRAAGDDPAARLARLAFAERITNPAEARLLTDRMVPRLLGATTRADKPEVLARVAAVARLVPGPDIAWAQRAIAGRAPGYDVLTRFTGPAMVLAGTEDELVPLAEARRTARVLQQGTLRLVPGAGHLLPLEAPRVITSALRSLLDRIRTPQRQPG